MSTVTAAVATPSSTTAPRMSSGLPTRPGPSPSERGSPPSSRPTGIIVGEVDASAPTTTATASSRPPSTTTRVAIARAIVTDPTLLVADEPTGDLDKVSAGEIMLLLERLNTEFAKTIIMVTHDPRAAEKAHKIRHLDKGELS